MSFGFSHARLNTGCIGLKDVLHSNVHVIPSPAYGCGFPVEDAQQYAKLFKPPHTRKCYHIKYSLCRTDNRTTLLTMMDSMSYRYIRTCPLYHLCLKTTCIKRPPFPTPKGIFFTVIHMS